MDLKIQRSCGLTTSRLKGSGFGFLQSDPHCALHCSTAAVIPTRSGSAEAVMTIHFLRCCQLPRFWKRRNMYSRPAVMVGRGNMLGLFVRDTTGFMVYLNSVIMSCAPSEFCWVTEKVCQHLSIFLQTFNIYHFEATFHYSHNYTEKKLKLESFDDPPPNSQQTNENQHKYILNSFTLLTYII